MAAPVPPIPPLPPVVAVFVPMIALISNISNANPAVVTTTANNNYLPGLYVRITIPYTGCMDQLAGTIWPITILSPTTFSIPVNTTNYIPFVDLSPVQQAQVVPVSEYTGTLVNAVDNIAPAQTP